MSKRGGPLYNQTIESSISNKKYKKKNVLASSSEEESEESDGGDALFAVAEADKSSDENEIVDNRPSLKKVKAKVIPK